MVSVIAIPGFEVIGEIDVVPDQSLSETGGSTYADDVVVSSDGTRMYVSRGGHRDVVAFGLPDGDLLWRVETDGLADHFALSPDGSMLFVSVYSEDRVHVIDTAEGQELARIASCSSALRAERLYVPGTSISVTAPAPGSSVVPVCRSTVTPG